MPSVDATVTALVPEFELAYARDAADQQYAIMPDTAGTPWHQLQPGQHVRLAVAPPPVRVLRVDSDPNYGRGSQLFKPE